MLGKTKQHQSFCCQSLERKEERDKDGKGREERGGEGKGREGKGGEQRTNIFLN
jgi:hypothetical protein